MVDINYKKLEVGQDVFFCINMVSWKGKVVSIHKENGEDIATFLKTEYNTYTTLNSLECSRYLSII